MDVALTFDDVLLVPRRSGVDSRTDVDTITDVGNLELSLPIISSPMESVTGVEMAQAMADAGTIGIIHRFQPVGDQTDAIASVNGRVGAAVGMSDGRDSRLLAAGANFLCLDIAHGHMWKAEERVEQLSEYDVPIMAGAVATKEATRDLALAGADIIRVGVGPGSACTTREVAGVGFPQLTAIQECVRTPHDVSIVADGGIKRPGDAMKALMAGADAVILGGQLAGCKESEASEIELGGMKMKEVRGMASADVQKENDAENVFVEGETYLTEYYGPVEDRLQQYENGIRSGLSYCGSHTIEGARRNAQFVRITPSAASRGGIHGN